MTRVETPLVSFALFVTAIAIFSPPIAAGVLVSTVLWGAVVWLWCKSKVARRVSPPRGVRGGLDRIADDPASPPRVRSMSMHPSNPKDVA